MEKYIGVWRDNNTRGTFVGYLEEYQHEPHLHLLAKFDDFFPAYAFAQNVDEEGVYVGNNIPVAGERTDDGYFQVTKLHRNDIFDYLEHHLDVDEDILKDFSVSEEFLSQVADRISDNLTEGGLYWEVISTCLDGEYPEFMAKVRGA